jgi:protein-disulfide isomerase
MSKLKPPVSLVDHYQGLENAPIVLVEYGDYQCPSCGQAYPILKQVQKAMGDKLKFVFRNFPLAEIHPAAVNAATAAEVAAGQGKFWEMHDVIFEHQYNLSYSQLFKLASMAKLDVTQFEMEYAKEVYRKRIDADFESGVRSGVNGTPSFFINGEKYNGSWQGESLLMHLKNISDE